MSVERLARALGVWSDGGEGDLVGLARKQGAALIKVMDSDGFRVWTPTTRTGLDQHWRLYVDPHDVDEGTSLMLFLLALAAELRLDVGLCPACVGSKLKGGPSNVEGLDTRPDRLLCPECSEPGEPEAIREGYQYVSLAAKRVGDLRQDGWTARRTGPNGAFVVEASRPGPPQPTGRRILGVKAILEAMPRLAEHFYSSPQQRAWSHHEPGDKATRDALAVRADKLQTKGDPFGELLALWLRGVCPECEGSGEEPEPSVLSPADLPVTSALCRTKVRPARRGDAGWPGIRDWIEVDTSCLKCHGHGTLLGAEWAALESLVELWCGRLECGVCTFGGLRTSWQTELCACGGTGRKK